MDKASIFASALILIGMVSSCEQGDPPDPKWELVWSDEFEGDKLDETVWDIQTGDGINYGLFQWGNNEKQYYTADNITLSEGKLYIRTKNETTGGYDYTSGRIRSNLGANFKYGRIEASIKVDTAGGLWSAFWMLPTDANEPWPISGEIDIMEHLGNDYNNVINALHYADAGGNQVSETIKSALTDPTSFHKYSVTWDENKIVWALDDVETMVVSRSSANSPETWPFDAEFHILLNVAVGGNLGGTINQEELSKETEMLVDYVRVYQLQ